jgi:hypothetical protein
MSNWKAEGLSGAEWGFRAAFSLMAEHRTAIAILVLAEVTWALLGADFLSVLPTETAFVLNPALPAVQPILVFEGLCGAFFEVLLVSLFLNSMSVTPTKRAFVYAALISISVDSGFDVYNWLRSQVEPMLATPAISTLAFLASIVFIVLSLTYLLCIVCQTLVDGKPSLSRSFQGVSGRLMRVWVAIIFLSLLPRILSGNVAFLVPSSSLPAEDIPVWMSHVENMAIFLWGLAYSILFAALSVVWFLSPIQRPPEESTTWVVPEGSLQR